MPYGIYDKIICTHGKHPEFIPQEHQSEVLDYFLNKLKYKGLLLFHKLGSGKSCSSIMISDEMLKASKVKKVFVMSPGSLRQNFIEEYCDRCGYKPEMLKKHYTFITTNFAVGQRLPDLNNSLIIIDEVHNLINGVKNQSKHATLIYNKLMKSDCKILALTGTPVFNYIWEWPFLGNLLKPGSFTDLLRFGELNTESFMKKFIIDDEGNVKPKNPKMFATKLRGIISYFPGKGDGYYPEVIHEDPILVRMSPKQEKKYWHLAGWEEEIRIKGPPDKTLLRKSPKDYYDKMEEYIMATKYIMSRYASNFFYPEKFESSTHPNSRDEPQHIGKVLKYLYKPTGEIALTKKHFVDSFYNYEIEKLILEGVVITPENEASITKKIKKKVENNVKKNVRTEYELENIGWVDKTNFSDKKLIDVYSRKFAAIIINIVSNWNAKHLVFSFYKTKAGVNMIHALFKMCGIKTEIYSGDISDGKRRKILKTFNAENNRYGQKIKALLVTEAGAEGINVLETQHMHIVESSTRELKIQQAIGRVVRYRSHMVEGRTPMPKHEQVVHIWRYWSIPSNEPFILKRTFKKQDGTTETITKVFVDKTGVDEILYRKGRVTVNTMQSFLSLLKNASVTSYDKDYDKEGRLKDYGVIKIPPKLEDAYDISDKRSYKNKDELDSDNSTDTRTDIPLKDIKKVIGDIDKIIDKDADTSKKNKVEKEKDDEEKDEIDDDEVDEDDEEKDEIDDDDEVDDDESSNIKIIASEFKKKGEKGDFKWMIKQPEYKDALFIFNDHEQAFLSESCEKGQGNAVIRPYQCKDPPKAVGIPMGIYTTKKGKGYKKLTPYVKEIIDLSFEKIQDLIDTGRYKRLIYSGTKDSIGTEIFKVGKDVKKYIIKRLYGLKKL